MHDTTGRPGVLEKDCPDLCLDLWKGGAEWQNSVGTAAHH